MPALCVGDRSEPIDVGALRGFKNALFSTVSCMQIAGRLSAPKPGDPHDTYLEWDLALKRVLVLILAECMNVRLESPPIGAARPAGNGALLNMLTDAVEQIQVTDDMQNARRKSALNLVEYLLRADDWGHELDRASRDEAAQFLGPAVEGPDFEAELETFVRTAPPEQDEKLLRYFAAQVERRVQGFRTHAHREVRLQHVYLPPIEWRRA